MNPSLLFYELNEVPWRVIDRHVERRPDGHLARLLARSDQYVTHCPDRGELQPWSTWPTLHRGVGNEVHGIEFLNQDLSAAAAWPPLWRLLADAGVPIGVFGSLQSFPPETGEHVRFHVPDTFAAASETHPPRYEAFQGFNLRQTGENKAVASRLGAGDVLAATGLLRSGIRVSSALRVARHLVGEAREPLYRKRRSLLQPVLAFDVFMDALRRGRPRYATFFSNHVAGIMHRYWKYSFPEDFDPRPEDGPTERFHARSLDVAMDLFEDQLGALLEFGGRHGYEIVVCSSMGQEAIDRGEYVPEIRLSDFERFRARLAPDFPVRMKLAMQPDVAFEFDSIEDRDRFRARMDALTDEEDRRVLEEHYAPAERTLSLKLARSRAVARSGTVLVDGSPTALAELGLETIVRDIGTAYHQPEGVCIWQRGSGTADASGGARERVDSRRVAPTVLAHFDVARPDYMMAPLERRPSGALGRSELSDVAAGASA